MDFITTQGILGFLLSIISYNLGTSRYVLNVRKDILDKDVEFRNINILEQRGEDNSEKIMKFKLENAYDFLINYEKIRGINSKEKTINDASPLLFIFSVILILIKLGKDIIGTNYDIINIIFSSIHLVGMVVILYFLISAHRFISKIAREPSA